MEPQSSECGIEFGRHGEPPPKTLPPASFKGAPPEAAISAYGLTRARHADRP